MEKTCMRSIVSYIPLVLATAVLLIALILGGTSRLEYCGQPETLRPHDAPMIAAKPHWPTLAPPQKVVFIRVEADKPDLQVGWADN
jgi:hypothetical protein